jgi:pyridoxine kinase
MSKRVLAIHDLSGFGSTSLMAVIPIMSRFGIKVTALPSALLSANTCYPHYAWLDTSAFMQDTIKHYAELKQSFAAIYSGFLGSAAQVQTVSLAVQKLASEDTLVVIDPVMADDGQLYGCYDDSIVSAMRELVGKADIITPNFTEACLLAGFEYRADYSEQDMQELCLRIAELGPKSLIITSVPDAHAGDSRVLHYTIDGGLTYYDCNYIPAFYPGTGDIFCSLLLALIIRGSDIKTAIPVAIDVIHKAISFSLKSGEDHREGVLLEQLLWQEDLL